MTLIPDFFLDCVVAIGVPPGLGDATATQWAASGFFYGRRLDPDGEPPGQYGIYLVSNRHVFGDHDALVVRANPPADDPSSAKDYTVQLKQDGARLWIGHSDEAIDVAVIRVNFNLLQDEGRQVMFFHNDQHASTAEQIRAEGVTEGDAVFVLGFPMGLVGDHRSVVIVRNGSIARIRDALAATQTSYLVDSAVFPGNSGGPVVLRPEAMSITGTQSPSSAALIGIVSGYVPYREVAISAQTGNIRMIFEENSGLASVHLVDAINDCIDSDPLFCQQQMQPTAPAPDA